MSAAALPSPEAPRRKVLPPALRLPAAAGMIVFAVALGTTQIALQISNREADAHFERLGQVYLDGLAASVRAGLEADDAEDVARGFARAFAEQRGLAERALFAFAPDGRLIARSGDPSLPPERAADLAPDTMRIDTADGTAWVSGTVEGQAGTAGRVVAALDIGPILAARARLVWGILVADLLLATLFAVLTWLALRRLGRPLRKLVEALSQGAQRSPARLPDRMVAGTDPRTATVLAAYNRMVDGMRERERLAAELAEKEQAAALGRLSATIAHEVRNPLGGLATAVSTLRRFGADPEVREESLAFLERGIGALDRIVTSTLNVYRPEEDRRLTRADLDDLRHLLRPAAEQNGVALSLRLDLPEGELALASGGVRQVLLNLLLNAIAATPRGGTVELHVAVEGAQLVCEVTDEGAGLDPAGAERLAGRRAEGGARSRRLGLDVVVNLLGSLDARASVTTRPEGGTLIRLVLPLGAVPEPAR